MIDIITALIGFGAVLIFPFVTIQFLYETYEDFFKTTNNLYFPFCPLTPERTFCLYSNVQYYIFQRKHKKRWINENIIKSRL